MGKTRDVLGHVKIEIAMGKRKCHHSRGKHFILKNSAHLAVQEGSFGARKNYCSECAKQILDHAKARLAEMEAALCGAP